MELQDYLFIARKNWLAIVAGVVLGALVGLAYALLATPTYSATAKVFVSTSGASSVAELQQGNSFSLARVKTYSDLVRTSAVLQPVIDSADAHATVAELRNRVSATAPLNTTVINVTVADTDPARAARLATAAAESLITVVEDIETTNSSVGSPVRLTLVQEADVPSAPTSPNKTLSLLVGIVLGLGVGILFALLRTTLDTRIRNERDLEHVTERPVLGGIVFDPKAKERPLIVHADSASPRAESFRTLRTNLQFLDLGEGGRSFVITSSEPDEGKSTTAANLALALAFSGGKVLLVEADLRRPKVASYLRVEGGAGLTDVLVGRMELKDAIQRWGTTDLYVLPSGSIPPNPSELLGSSRMAELIAALDAEFDYVLYDAPPLLPVTDAAVLARLVGAPILIVAAGKTRAPQVRGALAALENVGVPAKGIVLTMLPTRGPDAYGYGRYGYVYKEDKN